MSDTVSKKLREVLDNPKTRFLIVDAWRKRKLQESESRITTPPAASPGQQQGTMSGQGPDREVFE